MKKLALLLIFALLLPCLAACGGNGSEGSTDESPAEASEVSGEEAKELVTNPKNATNVSLNKEYKAKTSASEDYPDTNGTELTDGITASSNPLHTDSEFSGYLKPDVLNVDINLGKKTDKIYEFKCGYLALTDMGVNIPAKITVSGSDDGKKFELIGEFEIPEPVEGTRAEASYLAEYYVSAQYIRFSFTYITGAAWLFLDELTVIADTFAKADMSAEVLNSINQAYKNLGVVSFEGGKAPDESLAFELMSKGAGYEASAEPLDKDNGALTDGSISASSFRGNYLPFKGGDSLEFIVDLGEQRDDLCLFKTYCFADHSYKILLPVAVTYAVSDNGTDFTDIGRVYSVAGNQGHFDFPLSLSKCASGRYIRFTLEATDTEEYCLEELAVYSRTGVKNEASDDGRTYLYPAVVLDTEEKSHQSPSGKQVNLIQGKPVQIECPAEVAESNNNSPITLGVMTDGNPATANDIHNGQYFKLFNGGYRDIYYDFGATSAVKRVTAQFTHNVSWGVTATPTVDIALSENGTVWYSAAKIDVTPQSANEIVKVEHTFKKPIKARFIRYTVYIDLWVGIGELEAFGTTSVSGAVSLENSGAELISDKGYLEPDTEILNGASDLMLLYQRTDRRFSVEELIPFLAYVDSEGSIKDTMFDSFLFLMSGSFPSGRGGTEKSTKADWEWTIQDLFAEGGNLLALEEAAGRVKAELGLGDDCKYPFTVSLYYPNTDVTDFGDINGDGVSEAFDNDKNRLAALEWYMNTFEAKLAEYDFKNIEFGGYYWYNESITTRGNSPYIVKETAKEVHSRGYDFIWIPYFLSNGFTDWEALGFDAACMQPNYVFDDKTPFSNLEVTASLAKLHGMGVEIEMDYACINNAAAQERYLAYLTEGARLGYMKNTWHMYYQDVTALYTCSKASGKARELYDRTYQFIKGILPAYPDAAEPLEFTAKAGELFIGSLAENALEGTEFALSLSSEQGSVSVSADGKFIFCPPADFKGSVTFAYTYNAGMGESKPSYVTIIIE